MKPEIEQTFMAINPRTRDELKAVNTIRHELRVLGTQVGLMVNEHDCPVEWVCPELGKDEGNCVECIKKYYRTLAEQEVGE